MIEKLKQYPLVGLALAVAGGIVLAHFALQLCNYVYYNFIEDNLGVVSALAALVLCGAGLFFLARWLRKNGKMPRKSILVFAGSAILIFLWFQFCIHFGVPQSHAIAELFIGILCVLLIALIGSMLIVSFS